jgi:zona occludens toxin (predicted ATPase)
MAVHTLVVGTPGAGKSLYTLWELVRPLVGTTVQHEERDIPRRIVVGNVRDLLLDHVPMTVPAVNPEEFKEPHPDLDRQPGEPPLDVEVRVTSWWLWCQPGDVIVVDECQRAFRPFASGRRIPNFIAKLETARHYGVEFIFVTQHPQLLHLNVRNLIGRQLLVRRLFAGMQTVVYEWDHCTHPDRLKNATATPWRHKKAAFGLYKSAEVHTKGKASMPFALVLLLLAALALPAIGWYAYGRINREKAPVTAPKEQGEGVTTTEGAKSLQRAVFVAPVGEPAFAQAIIPRKTWPEALAGCFQAGDECSCVTQESPPRVITDRPALCLAVVGGDLVPPPSHPRPERIEAPERQAQPASQAISS